MSGNPKSIAARAVGFLSPHGPAYWLITAVAFAALLIVVAFHTPDERTMGTIQKIFYLHLPVAINTFLACTIVCVASIGYLAQRKLWWDDLAAAAAKVAVIFGAIVLLTGMIWGKSAWGAWWTWSPKLTFALILWLLYVAYLVIRPSIDGAQRRALVSAVYGVIAFLDVPLVYLSSRMMPDIHPTSIDLAPAMERTLLLGFLPVTLMAIGLIVKGYRVQRRMREASAARRADDHLVLVHPRREVA